MFRKILFVAFGVFAPALCLAQENGSGQPQVKVHMLNVCSPSSEEQQEISGALSRIPNRPAFTPDFEVDRGRSLLDQSTALLAASGAAQPAGDIASADFVRIRRDFSGEAAYSNVQYSFSRDSKQMVETLVFRVRDPKNVLQVSIEDSASSVISPSAMLDAGTPASRIKLERFGNSSVVLARCSAQPGSPAPDQSAYEPLFTSASAILSRYRGLLGARKLIPVELTRINDAAPSAAAARKPSARSHK